MNLRFTVIAVCSCLCAGASAQAGAQSFRDFTESRRLVQKLRPVAEAQRAPLGCHAVRDTRAAGMPMPGRAAVSRDGQGGSPEGKPKLDCIIVRNTDGSNYIRQKFVYGPIGKETNRQISYWNAGTGTWDEPYEEYSYKWTDYGYIESEQGISRGAGVRVDYKYNEQRLGIEQVNYALGSDGVTWVPQSKGEYKYDGAGNIIEERIYAWDGGKWANSVYNKATWDAKKRQTSIESYLWDGSAWAGATKGGYVWFDGPYDPSYTEDSGVDPERMTCKYDYFWIDGKWEHYYTFENKIREDGRLVGQAERFFNRATGKFSGGDDWDGRLSKDLALTWESTKSYDDHGAELYTETSRCLPDSSGWVPLGYTRFNWTYAGDGSREGYTTSVNCLYDADFNKTGEATFYREYYGYDAAGRKTWVLQQVSADGQTEPESLFEEKYVYDGEGRLLCTAVWDWDENGERKPSTRTDYTRDADGNVVESVSKNGGSGMTPIGAPAVKAPGMTGDDEKGWNNSARYTYTYDNGCMTSKMGYTWMQEEWKTNTGQDWVYDWDFPAADIIVPEGWTDPYKLEAVTDYYGDGAGGWLTMPREYFWTEFTATGISGVTGGKGGVRVWPTVVGESFSVEASGGARVSVYSMSGALVLTSAPGRVSVSGLPSGVYIVSVDGCRTKIVKK